MMSEANARCNSAPVHRFVMARLGRQVPQVLDVACNCQFRAYELY